MNFRYLFRYLLGATLTVLFEFRSRTTILSMLARASRMKTRGQECEMRPMNNGEWRRES